MFPHDDAAYPIWTADRWKSARKQQHGVSYHTLDDSQDCSSTHLFPRSLLEHRCLLFLRLSCASHWHPLQAGSWSGGDAVALGAGLSWPESLRVASSASCVLQTLCIGKAAVAGELGAIARLGKRQDCRSGIADGCLCSHCRVLLQSSSKQVGKHISIATSSKTLSIVSPWQTHASAERLAQASAKSSSHAASRESSGRLS